MTFPVHLYFSKTANVYSGSGKRKGHRPAASADLARDPERTRSLSMCAHTKATGVNLPGRPVAPEDLASTQPASETRDNSALGLGDQAGRPATMAELDDNCADEVDHSGGLLSPWGYGTLALYRPAERGVNEARSPSYARYDTPERVAWPLDSPPHST